jgi:hypothetical protein
MQQRHIQRHSSSPIRLVLNRLICEELTALPCLPRAANASRTLPAKFTLALQVLPPPHDSSLQDTLPKVSNLGLMFLITGLIEPIITAVVHLLPAFSVDHESWTSIRHSSECRQ